MLDRIPALVRHLILALIPVVLGFVATEVVPALQDWNPLVAALVAAVVQQITLYATTLTRQYGVGSGNTGAMI